MAGEGFLGRGWSLPVSIPPEDAQNPLAPRPILEARGEEKIRQSMVQILATAPGERIGRPEFGCGIHELVFATRTAGTLGGVMRAVTEALQRWEPRVEVLSVDARPHPDDPRGILVEIHYEVRATNSRYNLVYPFYLAT